MCAPTKVKSQLLLKRVCIVSIMLVYLPRSLAEEIAQLRIINQKKT